MKIDILKKTNFIELSIIKVIIIKCDTPLINKRNE